MNKPMNYMSTSLMESRLNSSTNHNNNNANTSARVYSAKKHPDMNHSIDFNHLAEKLKKLQQMTENEPDESNNVNQTTDPIQSSYSPSKSTIKYKNPTNPMVNTTERERLRPPAKKSIPRSLSNLDKHPNLKNSKQSETTRRSADRSQSQLHHNKSTDLSKNNQIYEELGEESNDFFKTSKTLQNKSKSQQQQQQQQLQQKLNMVRNSLNLSSMKQAANNSRKLSESLRSNSSISSSDTSRSENISFQSESLVSLSCSSRSSSSSPKHRKPKNNEIQKKTIKRGVSSLGVPSTNKPKIIVIRREKSIACQSSTNDLANVNQSQTKPQQIKSTKIHKNKYVNEEHLIMKQNLLASLSIPLNSNHDANNSGHSQHNQVISNSSTTSGIELSSKNSTNGVNSANGDGSSENIPNMNHTVKNCGDCDEPNNWKSSTINELKNRIFIMELELDNQGKKLAQEKDLKRKLVTELKTRYETEKHAALKALDAKLNAEKLFELNKLKEQIDVEKRDESDLNQRSFDCELLNLKLKLREKSEKCSKLEKMLKEEQNKNTLLFSKSMEIVKKYNQEMKHFNGMQNKGSSVQNNVSIQAQTDSFHIEDDFDKRENAVKEQLIFIQSILETEPLNNGKQMVKPNTKELAPETDLQTILQKIESLAKKLKNNNENSSKDLRSMQRQYDKLNDDFKSCKEAKQKLESLYKIKCKSDLNKSAQIKKCQLNYELELLKFRNEFNCDLVLHLESQLSSKESKIFEQNNQLENVIDLIENLNTLNLSNECLKKVNLIKDSIKVINNNLKKNMSDVQTFNNGSTGAKCTKVFNPSVLFTRINDEVNNCNDGLNNSNFKIMNEKEKGCFEKNLQLQNKIELLDRQLNEMKITNKKLTNEKQELLNQTADSQNKSNMNVTVIENQFSANADTAYNTSALSNRLIQPSTFERRLNFPKKSSSSVRDNFVKTGSHFASRKNSDASPVKHGYFRSSQQTDLNLVKEKQNQSAPL